MLSSSAALLNSRHTHHSGQKHEFKDIDTMHVTILVCSTLERSRRTAAAGMCVQQQPWASHRCAHPPARRSSSLLLAALQHSRHGTADHPPLVPCRVSTQTTRQHSCTSMPRSLCCQSVSVCAGVGAVQWHGPGVCVYACMQSSSVTGSSAVVLSTPPRLAAAQQATITATLPPQ